MDKLRFYIFDAYNHHIYPADEYAKQAISCDINVAQHNSDARYLRKLEEELPRAIESFQPDMIIYNAGTDCLLGDPLGDLNITERGIVKRDEIVFRLAIEKYKVPIVMVLSGGY